MSRPGLNSLAYLVEDAEGLGTAWRQRAACRGVDPSLFFPGKGDSAPEARRVCAGCPVRDACLEYALVGGETYGIWGGVPELQRKRMRRQRRRGAA